MKWTLIIVRIVLIILLIFALFMWLLAMASGHNIPARTTQSFEIIIVIIILLIGFLTVIKRKKFDKRA